MAKMKFTKVALDRLASPTGVRVDYFDTETPGLGLRVGSNSKTFFVKIDIKDPTTKTGFRSVRKTLGRFGELTLEQARKELLGYDDREKGFVPGIRLESKLGNTKRHGSDFNENPASKFALQRQNDEPPTVVVAGEKILIPGGQESEVVFRVDEAGFLGARQAERLLDVITELQQRGLLVKLHLLGDSKQMQVIQAGDQGDVESGAGSGEQKILRGSFGPGGKCLGPGSAGTGPDRPILQASERLPPKRTGASWCLRLWWESPRLPSVRPWCDAHFWIVILKRRNATRYGGVI